MVSGIYPGWAHGYVEPGEGMGGGGPLYLLAVIPDTRAAYEGGVWLIHPSCTEGGDPPRTYEEYVCGWGRSADDDGRYACQADICVNAVYGVGGVRPQGPWAAIAVVSLVVADDYRGGSGSHVAPGAARLLAATEGWVREWLRRRVCRYVGPVEIPPELLARFVGGWVPNAKDATFQERLRYECWLASNHIV